MLVADISRIIRQTNLSIALTNISLCLAVLCLCAFPYVHTQVAEKLFYSYNSCAAKTTCHECMQTPSCAWCFSPDFNQMARCFQPSYPSLQSRLCPEEYVWNPDNILQMLVSKELSRPHVQFEGGGRMSGSNSSSSSTSSSGLSSRSSSSNWEPIHFSQSEIVQVRPQRVNLKLRARESYTLRMHYTQAEDYPVDLYYLMGLGKSMEDKDKLSKLGNLLAETITNITSNFRLGFGSIVDNLQEPCEGCATPYGFKNFMSLSRDTNKFSQMVERASVSGNLDAPEGGFDAIMQAIVCRHEIGWREKARRLLVFSTDAGFHYAGDGKLGDIITPNDGRCHLERGLYTHSTVQDYPSISEINLKVKQNAIHVIFAVTESQISVYKRLQEQVEGSSISHLYNYSNIVELIKNHYEQISSTVSMKDNSTSTVKINYYSKCLNATSPERKTNKCGNIKVGDVVTFKVEIEMMSCPADPKEWLQTLQIYPVGLNESLTVNLEMLCGCPCEMPSNVGYEVSSPRCNYFGTYKCGICECDSSHFGQTCECSTTVINNLENTLGCRPGNATTLDCSGRGICLCGHCECNVRLNEDEKIYGNYCECDNFSCDRHEGNICSGPTHGTCECGVCQCKEPWGGPACGCKMSNETCYTPDVADSQICSGYGECICGICHCERSEVTYSGRFCENL